MHVPRGHRANVEGYSMNTERLITVRTFIGVETADGTMLSEEPISAPEQMTLTQLGAMLDSMGGDQSPTLERLAESVSKLDYNILLMQIADVNGVGFHVWLAPADALGFVGVEVGRLPNKSVGGVFSAPSTDNDETFH